MPAEETQASASIRLNPEYDGRGTVVAVLDTDFDPAARGLQKTSDGQPKILDILVCSGLGDLRLARRLARRRRGVRR